MTSHRTRILGSVFAALLVCSLVSFGCGGSSGGGTTTGPVTTFTPDAPVVNGSIAMLAGGTSGATITIRIAATQINNFFGAAFHINYDSTALRCNGMDSTGSFLLNGVTANDVVFLEDHTTTPGVVVVTASRLDPTVAGPVNVTTTADLVTLSFSATKAIAPGSATGLLSFDDPKQVCDGTAAYPVCGSVPSITWIGGTISSQ